MPRFDILDAVPEYIPLTQAKGAQLIRVAMKLKPGQCLQIKAASKDEARKYRVQMFERATPPIIVAPTGYTWHTSIRKIATKRFVLLVWLAESRIQNPESPESTIAEPESPYVDEP